MNFKLYFIIILIFSIFSCRNDSTHSEYNVKEITKIENEFVYKLLSSDLRPSGKVFQILKNKEKKYIGNLAEGIPYGDWIKLNDDGNILEKTHFSNGTPGRKYVAIYYENGEKNLEGSYLHDRKNGLFVMYHENGVKSFRGEYRNGLGIGIWSYYDDDGLEIKKIDCSVENCK